MTDHPEDGRIAIPLSSARSSEMPTSKVTSRIPTGRMSRSLQYAVTTELSTPSSTCRSYDIIGERVVFADREFIVSGVVREQDSAIDREVGTDAPRAYIYFNALESIAKDSGATFDPGADTSNLSAESQELLSGADGTSGEAISTSSECAILCYEAMLPELVKGVANTDIKSAIPGYTEADPKFS